MNISPSTHDHIITNAPKKLSRHELPIKGALSTATIGIIGVGMVGGAVKRYFEQQKKQIKIFDTHKKLGSEKEVNEADIIFICVPTPYSDTANAFDLSCLREAISSLKSGKIIVLKSTMLPGTTEAFQREFPQHCFSYNPEFLTEATADQDMSYPDRQIIGYTEKSFPIAKDLLQLFPLAPFERVIPSSEAEMVKFFGNTWFATKVAFANQMYDLCQKIGVDYELVKESTSADKRIGRTHLDIFHKGYRGYGGKCLPKDIKALIGFADREGVSLNIHKAAESVNNSLLQMQEIKDPENYSKRE